MLISVPFFGFGQRVISGQLTENGSGESVPFATIMIKGTNVGVVSNSYGFYSLTIKDKYIENNKVSIQVSYMGFEKKTVVVDFEKGSTINIKLKASETTLQTVEVRASATRSKERLRATTMSTTKLQMRNVKNIPAIGGETDILKVIQLLPGVSGGTEGSTSLFVRGGDADQNLVLLDESTVYNVGHLFGFFSVFNSDAISDMTILKGAFPSSYGGRLSSILDIRMKEGHSTEYHGAGGIGLLSSRFMVEGPIIKEKMSFLISGRRTYIDKVFKLVGVDIPYYFYDLNVKMNYKISDKDRLFYSMYYGNDILKISEEKGDEEGDFGLDFGFSLGNITNTLRWNHIYNSKLFSNTSLIFTKFDYKINGKTGSNNLFINSNIFDVGLKTDFDYFKNNENHIKYGISFIHHTFKPNIIKTSGEIADYLKNHKAKMMNTQELGVYILSDKTFNEYFRINYGVRLSTAKVNQKFYGGIEPRIALRYLHSDNNSFKISYSRMKQYMHRVSSSTVALPTDLWYPITENVKPQIADQIAAAYNHNFDRFDVSLEVEVYYKWMQNLIEYREGANLILNDNFDAELLQGTGRAYGAEFLLRKEEGRLNGWVAYTIGKTTRYFDELNKGKVFPAKYDRRHNISVVVNYEISKRWLFSAVWVYQSGSRFTGQIGQYFMPNPDLTTIDIIPIYTDRNAVEMSPSHRLDLNLTLKPKKKRKINGEWSFGCYNLYNRAQPYRINIDFTDNGDYKYTQPGLFGFIPSIAYNFKF